MNQIFAKVQIWILACRPKTLTAAFAPIIISAGMAYGDGVHHLPTVLVSLGVALLLQIGTNISNDYFDWKNGADRPGRVGPTRVTQSGLVKPSTVLAVSLIVFALAGLLSTYLIYRGGWMIAVLAVVSIASGLFYTAGPKPLGYLGLGDLFVLIFFGPVAVAGCYYVQSFEMHFAVILAGVSAGLLSTAILCVNNYRDRREDAETGKKTLAVRFGPVFAQYEYLVCVIVASLIPVLIFYMIDDHKPILLASLTCVMAIPAIHTLLTADDGPRLNRTLAFTGKLLMVFSLIFALGWSL